MFLPLRLVCQSLLYALPDMPSITTRDGVNRFCSDIMRRVMAAQRALGERLDQVEVFGHRSLTNPLNQIAFCCKARIGRLCAHTFFSLPPKVCAVFGRVSTKKAPLGVVHCFANALARRAPL